MAGKVIEESGINSIRSSCLAIGGEDMSKSQWVKTLTRLSMLTVLGASLWQLPGSAKYLKTQDRQNDQNPILVTATQLLSIDGVVPVSLQCQTQNYLKPTKGKALRCVLKNNFSSPITAVSLAYIIKYEANGQKSTD